MKLFQSCKFALLATAAALLSVSTASAAPAASPSAGGSTGGAGNANNADHQLLYKPNAGGAGAAPMDNYKMMVDDYGKSASEYNKVVDYTKGGVEYGSGVDAAYKQQQPQQQLLDSDDGYGKGYKHDDKGYHHQPYGFGYNIEDGYGNKQWRHEKSASPHQVTGSYGFKDKSGIMREVEYVADKHGFRAIIKTNEPGTASKDPAYVKMHAEPIHVDYYPKEGYSGKHGHGYIAASPAEGGAAASAAAAPASSGYGGNYQLKKELKYDDPSMVGGNDSYENEYAASAAQGKYNANNGKDNGAGIANINGNTNPKFADKKRK